MSEIDRRWDDIKAGALGTLPGRLEDLIARLPADGDDVNLLKSTIDRLDALAGDFAYNYLMRDRP